MKRLLLVLMCMGLVSMASAEVLTLYDNGGGPYYGAADGFMVDIDTTYNAYYDAPLVAGQQYAVDSISLYDASTNTTPVYISVFDYSMWAGFDGDTSAEHLGYSLNTIDFSATTDGTMSTFNFSGLVVTAGSDGFGGNGSLLITWDNDQVRNNWQTSGGPNALFRLDAGDPVVNFGAAIFAYGGLPSNRTPEIVVSLTAIPEPATMVLLGLGALVLRRKR